jgi:hypothetical protein
MTAYQCSTERLIQLLNSVNATAIDKHLGAMP